MADPWGNPWQFDGLNNLTIGSPAGRRLGIKDRSLHTGSLLSIDVYIKQDTPGGYSGGTFGQFTCRCESDDGSGLPSGSLLAAGATVTATSLVDSIFRFTFGTAVPDVAGTLRHFVFQNVDGSPTVNFSSINSMNLAASPTPVQPTYLDADRGVMKQLSGPPWVFDRDRYPIFTLRYADGYQYGTSYYDALRVSGQREIGSGGRKVRFNLTPTTSRIVRAFHGRFMRTSGTTADLTLNLRNLTSGLIVATRSFPASGVPVASDFANGFGMQYVDWTFDAPITLQAGVNYALEAESTQVSNPWASYPSRVAASGGFYASGQSNPDAFHEGKWQYTTDGVNWNDHSVGGAEQQMQGFFDVGAPQILVPTAPTAQPDQTLGCGIARAEVWTRGAGRRVIDLPDITATEWGRVRSDTSMGMVQMDGVAIAADPECCAILRDVRPWKHELHIYRDDELGWCGPITEIELDGPTLLIKGRDLSAWLDRRFIHGTLLQWGGTQANQGSENSNVLLTAIVNDALSPDSSMIKPPFVNLLFNTVQANGMLDGDLAGRVYSPAQFKPAGPEIRDLAKGPLDWTVVKREGYVNHSTWRQVYPNPVTNPTFEVNTTGWTGMTRDTGVFHSGVASGRTAATPNVTGSIVGLDVGRRYQLRCWLRGTSSALDAAQVPNYDGVVKVGNDESSVFSWYVYGQATTPSKGNRGRANWIQVGVFFVATATTMPITITATGNPQDSHGIYFDDFEVWYQEPQFALRDDSLAEPVKVVLSGLDQVNRAIVANQQSGGDYAFYKEAPKPVWTLGAINALTAVQKEYGLLEGIFTQPLADSASAQSAASARAAGLGETPILLDRIVLSPDAGVTMDQLIPGVLFTLRLDEPCFAVQAELVLQSVSVKTTASGGEQVTLGFDPTGF